MLPAFNLWAAAGDVRLDPAAATAGLNAAFGLKMLVDSGTKKLFTYGVKLTYDTTKLQVTTPPTTDGANPMTSVFMVNATVPGVLRVTGVQAVGVGPGTSLHPITFNFKCLGIAGSTPVGLTVEMLTDQPGDPIGAATPRAGVGSTVSCGGGQPDFIITGITAITPASPVINGTFSATVTVKNQGTGAGDGKMLSVWANNTAVPACGATGWAKQMPVGVLTAGQSKAIVFTGTTAIPTGTVSGTKMLRAFVDSACGTVETNETNNQLTSLYTAVTPAPAADLAITAIALLPAASAINGTFTANVTVKNQGTAASVATSVVNVWNHQPTTMSCGVVATKSVAIGASLAAGVSKVIPVTVIPAGAAAGMKLLRAYVDGTCTTGEVNEVNNQTTFAYAVNAAAPAADFSITSITLTPAAPAVGAVYSAAVVVKNNTATAGDGKNLEGWTNSPGALPQQQQYCGAVGNARIAVGSIPANGSVTKTISNLVAGAAGARTFRAYVDSACGTNETNEGNNQSIKAY